MGTATARAAENGGDTNRHPWNRLLGWKSEKPEAAKAANSVLGETLRNES